MSKKKVLVTGGAGYIGSHTILDLIEHGFEVVSIDNFSNATPQMLSGIQQLTGQAVHNYDIDLCDKTALTAVFEANQDICGIIHFAAFKAVGESVAQPGKYYRNNIDSLVNLLECVRTYQIPNLVFSSSCSVYGNTDALPVTEATPMQKAESPYAHTKQIGEGIIEQYARILHNKNILLRYFNPVGAHPSALLGELPVGKPSNLVPAITQTAIGKLPQLQVWGNDYPTPDGSCIRDYIHVCDIARAHTQALQYLLQTPEAPECDILNLGTGNGVSVLEAIHAFEKVSGMKLNYAIGPRRAGDVVAIYANNQKATTLLNWTPQYGIEDMMRSAWNWELALAPKV